jgi:spoIIIJ-associated protein
MNDQIPQNLKETAQTLLTLLALTGKVEVQPTTENVYRVDVQLDTIPKYGLTADTVLAFQHVLRLLTERGETRVVVDINDFQKQAEDQLKTEVAGAIDQAKTGGKVVYLRPMSAYERRQAHMMIEEAGGVLSESVGEEPRRRIIIKPAA